jgi:hypothetical protein
MIFRKPQFLILSGLSVLVMAGLFLLWPASKASAQCGSQASSCKNCHETQAQDPVNNDGTGWHVSHAFGDFCYICHAGNNQSMDKATAHTGMVAPMSDVKAACQSCHPSDLMQRAQVYATKLGVTVDTASSGAAPTVTAGTTITQTTTAGQTTNSTGGSSVMPASPGLVGTSSDANVIDYSQQYNQAVLGQRSINWGNVIVGILIVVVAVGGGAFVFWNERRLRGLPLGKTPGKTGQIVAEVAPVVEGYSSEVTALLPLLAQLNPVGLHSLKRLLANPEEANELLHGLSRLDPELIERFRSLDRDSRAVLLALAGD